MSIVIRKYIPLVIVAVVGFFMILSYPIDYPPLMAVTNELGIWLIILSGFAMVLGATNMSLIHLKRIDRREKGLWGPSISLLAGLVGVTLLGLFTGVTSEEYTFLYDIIIGAGRLTLGSILAFFQYSAFYRGFRARTFEGGLMLIGAVLIMMYQVPLAEAIFPPLNTLTLWLNDTIFVGANRGITIIGGIAMIVMALKLLMGTDKTWMGEQ